MTKAHPTRILLVDDHQLLRDGLRAILEKDGRFHVVGEASTGREAVRLAETLQPDVIVMDVAMHDLNGIEATRQIKAILPTTRILALSSYSDRRYVNAILEAGASGYVLKANAYQELLQAVETAVEGLQYLCAEVTSGIVSSCVQKKGAGSVYEILGAREREVLQLLAEGLTSAGIAARLHISPSTVETHRRNIMRKLDAHNVAQLTRYAIAQGLTHLEVPPDTGS